MCASAIFLKQPIRGVALHGLYTNAAKNSKRDPADRFFFELLQEEHTNMPPSSLARHEDGVSVALVIIVYLLGWLRAYHAMSMVHMRDVKDGTYAYTQLIRLSMKFVVPYMEVWVTLLCGIIILYIVDKLFVTIMSLSESGEVTLGDGYALSVFLAALKQWQIIGAIFASMATTIGVAVMFMYYMRVQKRPDEAILNKGLTLIQIFGLVLTFTIVAMQGVFIG